MQHISGYLVQSQKIKSDFKAEPFKLQPRKGEYWFDPQPRKHDIGSLKSNNPRILHSRAANLLILVTSGTTACSGEIYSFSLVILTYFDKLYRELYVTNTCHKAPPIRTHTLTRADRTPFPSMTGLYMKLRCSESSVHSHWARLKEPPLQGLQAIARGEDCHFRRVSEQTTSFCRYGSLKRLEQGWSEVSLKNNSLHYVYEILSIGSSPAMK